MSFLSIVILHSWFDREVSIERGIRSVEPWSMGILFISIDEFYYDILIDLSKEVMISFSLS